MDTQTEGGFGNVQQQAPVQTKKRGKRKFIIGGLLLVVVAAFGFLYVKYPQMLGIKTTEEKAQAETQDLIAQINKLIVSPTNEEPTVFEITDPEALIAKQPFFTGAEKGDKLLIYQKLARAIIYSPSRNIIVNVGPVTQEQPASSSVVPAPKTATSSTSKK